jgi:hypothetical protein
MDVIMWTSLDSMILCEHIQVVNFIRRYSLWMFLCVAVKFVFDVKYMIFLFGSAFL